MRIFERLRGRDQGDSAIVRRPLETITDDLLRKLDETSTFPESESTCRSCCSADQTARAKALMGATENL
ncbi:MAG: hypothetical protein PS018_22455 [bacterium]|nr:hypothetical protein [bacterium]